MNNKLMLKNDTIMKNKKIYILFFSVSFLFILSSCNSGNNIEEIMENPDELIVISKEQFVSENMKLGNSQLHTFNEVFKTNGVLIASPKSKAFVYSYFAGTIKQIFVTSGNYVRQGQILLSLESKEFIHLQRQYLEALAQQKVSNGEYERVKDLYNQKISSQKDYLFVESQYKAINAKIQALKAELKIAGVNFTNLENGKISSYLTVKAPIKGYVSELKCNIGQYVGQESILLKVIDNSNLQLHFYVYQETVENLSQGQNVSIYSADKPELKYQAVVTSIGKSIDAETKSIDCIAKPGSDVKKNFVDGMYFNVDVITDSLMVQAIPSRAIIESSEGKYVLVKEKEEGGKIFFNKILIKTGVSDTMYTQIMEDATLRDVLVEGTYYF